MPMTEQKAQTTGVRELSHEECLRHLSSNRVGRVAVVTPSRQPLMFPVNYAFDEGVVVFKTGAGTKLTLASQALVAFEIDGWDETSKSGWSVLVQGVAHDISGSLDAPSKRLRRLPVRPLAPGARERWVGIWANEITGRYF
jgi:nitroimidazol reductase NimA-like FMN-containing flavoprotein (pyridoxamine 5'-phosphate oxidase superfamily)